MALTAAAPTGGWWASLACWAAARWEAVEAALAAVAGADAAALASRFTGRFPNAYRYDVAAEDVPDDFADLVAQLTTKSNDSKDK